MKSIPKTENALVLRTDFSDESAWEAIRADIQEPVNECGEEFQACVDFLSDPEYDSLTVEQLVEACKGHTFIFIVDRVTLSHPDRPILVVDLYDEPGRTFRVVPSAMWAVENNLSLANMGFYEFADMVDQDGIFYGI
jgi:hypothetical protein